MRRLLCLVIALLLVDAVAVADVDISGMSVEELSDLRDKVNQAILAIEVENDSPSIFELENEYFSMVVTDIEVIGKDEVNDYYDRYKPGTRTSDDNPYLVLLFNFENKSDVTVDGYLSIEEASINGWMVSSYTGMRDIAPGKKCKGFIDARMIDCEAVTIEDIDSFEFTMAVRDTNRNDLGQGRFLVTHSGDNWIVTQ